MNDRQDKLRVAYVTNSAPASGMGHRAVQLAQRLPRQGVSLTSYAFSPSDSPLPKTIQWIRWGISQRAAAAQADIVHLTNQTLSFMAPRETPYVVTVHDLIERTEPQSWAGGILARYLYHGITGADHIIAVSEYTAQAVREQYGVSDDRITVIYNGVGSAFHPIDGFDDSVGSRTLRQDYKLGDSQPLILYVGSDHPRKNVVGALEVFATIRARHPNALFLKVGEAGLGAGRAATLETIDRLGIRDAVRLLSHVSNERLNELYNAADVLLYPSRFEGFGLPPLQAMAAGLPVVTSNTTSIPEVVGDAAVLHDPQDVEGMATSVEQILTDSAYTTSLRELGLTRAKQFSWERTADQVAAVYRQVR